jgi:hypothetical protein
MMRLYAFDAHYIKPVTIIVVGDNEQDARTDAYSAAFALSNGSRIIRLEQGGKRIKRLPQDATPIRGAWSTSIGQWAWYTVKAQEGIR